MFQQLCSKMARMTLTPTLATSRYVLSQNTLFSRAAVFLQKNIPWHPALTFSTTPTNHGSLQQMHKRGMLKKKPRRSQTGGKPQLKGVVLKVLIKKPKKPNSANRKCVRVRLSNGTEQTAYIPKEGHNLQEHSIVLVRGGRVQDVPGVRLKVIRGKYDLAHVVKEKA